jgi:hypothetical protein
MDRPVAVRLATCSSTRLAGNAARMVEHLAARVESDEHSGWVAREHALRGLAGARSEFKYALGVRPSGSDSLVLEALIVGHLRAHQRKICVRIPVKLRHVG